VRDTTPRTYSNLVGFFFKQEEIKKYLKSGKLRDNGIGLSYAFTLTYLFYLFNGHDKDKVAMALNTILYNITH
jgi:hypothetical protein